MILAFVLIVPAQAGSRHDSRRHPHRRRRDLRAVRLLRHRQPFRPPRPPDLAPSTPSSLSPMWLSHGLENALRMAWEVWWALVLGFARSGIVQAWVPRDRLRAALGGRGAREAVLSSGLGAASSSCSYA